MGESDVCIQWNGTEVCGDFHCECGGYAHICGAKGMYQIQCIQCDTIWHVPDRIVLFRSTNKTADASTVVAGCDPKTGDV